jgi:hypothetical protein
MQTNSKFIFQATGPLLTYRLDVLKEVSPEARHFILILTDKFSYENFFRKYDGFFEFVLMDEYRENHPISLEYEIFPKYLTQEEFYEKIESFYNKDINRFYPFDIHRFIFPYLMEKGILNFCFTDSDFIYNNNFEVLKDFFLGINPGTVYGPWHGEDLYFQWRKQNVWDVLQPDFAGIKLDGPFFRTCDGFVRGFHFKNLKEMEITFNLWNSALYKSFTSSSQLIGHGGKFICQTEWIISHIMQFLKYNFDYEFKDFFYMRAPNYNQMPGYHLSRPEDTIYIGKRQDLHHFNFDWSDMSSITNFIKNNKEQLRNYYSGPFRKIEITDTHVFTYL